MEYNDYLNLLVNLINEKKKQSEEILYTEGVNAQARYIKSLDFIYEFMKTKTFFKMINDVDFLNNLKTIIQYKPHIPNGQLLAEEERWKVASKEVEQKLKRYIKRHIKQEQIDFYYLMLYEYQQLAIINSEYSKNEYVNYSIYIMVNYFILEILKNLIE